MITITKKQFKPKTQVQSIKVKINNSYTEQSYIGTFFAVARTITGARYYSETYKDYNFVYNIFLLYKDMVKYFGGGNIELYCITPNGYDILESIHI